MAKDFQFDMALSYCAEDGGLARDFYKLVSQQGFYVYCYDYKADTAGGFLRNNLRDIFKYSRLNVLLWSADYSNQSRESLVGMERNIIANRHVNKGDDKSLVVVSVDGTPLQRDLDDILTHSLKKDGLLQIVNYIISRLKDIYMTVQNAGGVCHPRSTDRERGVMHPCAFQIDNNYKDDPHRRWVRLADVLVNLPNPIGTPNVYLIPSGLTNSLLGHTAMLKGDPKLLEYKRRATEKFVEDNKDREIKGFWFPMQLGDIEVATAYSEEYDRFLNKSLREFVSEIN